MTSTNPPTSPPVTLIIDVGADVTVLRVARACSDPPAGHVTVDPTPHTAELAMHQAAADLATDGDSW